MWLHWTMFYLFFYAPLNILCGKRALQINYYYYYYYYVHLHWDICLAQYGTIPDGTPHSQRPINVMDVFSLLFLPS